MKNIFIISKEAIITQKLTAFLKSQSFVTHSSPDLDLAAKAITEKKIDLIIIDMSFKEECVQRFHKLVFMKKIKIPTIYLSDIELESSARERTEYDDEEVEYARWEAFQ